MAQNLNKNSNCVSFGLKSIQKARVSNQFLRRLLRADGPQVLLSVLQPKSNEMSSPPTLNYPPTAKMNGKVSSRQQSNICQQT